MATTPRPRRNTGRRPPTTPEAASTTGHRLQPSDRPGLGKRLMEYFSLVTVGSFALSTVANQAVFNGWGLEFLQLATFADVTMSGLSLLIFTFPLAALLLVVWYIGELDGHWRWARRIALGFALFIFALSIWGIMRGQAREGASAAAAVSGILIVGFLTPAALRIRTARTPRAWIQVSIVAIFAAVTLFQIGSYTVQKYQVRGYGGPSPLYLLPEDTACAGRALWTGERAVVLDCGQDSAPGDIRVIFGQESGAYTTRKQPGQTL